MEMTFSLTSNQHATLKKHLFPGDGCEAGAIVLCGQRAGDRRHRLVARKIYPIPYDCCSERTPNQLIWPTDVIAPWLDIAAEQNLTVVKVHSHPSGCNQFSEIDNQGDRKLLPAIRDWIETEYFHGSTIMLPDGRMFGRYLDASDDFISFRHINTVGDDLLFWYEDSQKEIIPTFASSHAQAFGEGTFEQIRRLSIAVVGCSGTGSPVIEQLSRYGVGELVLVDDDIAKERNINRILNTFMTDVEAGLFKVDILADAIHKMGIGTRVIPIAKNLWTPEAVKAVAQCDIVFGCMDTVDGRFLLNMLATHYLIPYIDLGVKIYAVSEGPDKGQIQEVCGSVHYLKPGGSSLISRGLFTMKDVGDAGLARTDPVAHAQNVKDGYIGGVAVQRPAVISLNMNLASLGVHELLARIHRFRYEPNGEYEHTQLDLATMEMESYPYPKPCPLLSGDVGKGDISPLLGLTELSEGVIK